MNLDWYYTFIILKTLNYRLASEEINLTIPSIHKQIKNLEQHLNVKLFETYKTKLFLPKMDKLFYQLHKVLLNNTKAASSIFNFKRQCSNRN